MLRGVANAAGGKANCRLGPRPQRQQRRSETSRKLPRPQRFGCQRLPSGIRRLFVCQAVQTKASSGTESHPSDAGLLVDPEGIIRKFFEAFNGRDMAAVRSLYAEDCVHHDLAYDAPAVGLEETMGFIKQFLDSMPSDIQFVVEDTTGGSEAVGVIWRMEVGGVEMPLGKGISFYKLNTQGKITYVRECPEHFAKLAFAAPPILSIAAPLVRNLGPLQAQQGSTAVHYTPRASRCREKGGQHADRPAVPACAVAMSGKWSKDKGRSDLRLYGEALEMMGIRGIQKTTAQLIDGIELSVSQQEFVMRFLTIVPNFKVTEVYSFEEEAEIGRRDLRDGWQRGTVEVLADGKVRLGVQVGPADGWSLQEDFYCPSAGELCVRSQVTKMGKTVSFTTVYKRGHA